MSGRTSSVTSTPPRVTSRQREPAGRTGVLGNDETAGSGRAARRSAGAPGSTRPPPAPTAPGRGRTLNTCATTAGSDYWTRRRMPGAPVASLRPSVPNGSGRVIAVVSDGGCLDRIAHSCPMPVRRSLAWLSPSMSKLVHGLSPWTGGCQRSNPSEVCRAASSTGSTSPSRRRLIGTAC